MPISHTEANAYLNTRFGLSNAVSRPNFVYIGLCQNAPDASTGAITGEPTAESYQREIVGGSSADTQSFSTASGGVITNNAEIRMHSAREAWSTAEAPMNYWFLSTSTTGNAFLWGSLTTPMVIAANTAPTFYEGDLQASVDVPLTT